MKKILITGASGNLGKAAVNKFVAQGFHVIAIVSPGKTLGYETVSPVAIIEADLSVEKSVEETIAKIILDYKTIDAAVLTVGGFASGSIETADGTSIQKMLSVNFSTAYFVARPVFIQMLKQESGRIIFIGSRPALNPKEGKNNVAYALSKSLLFNFSEMLNASSSGKDVVCSVIVPSTIDTPANRQAMPKANFSQWVNPEDIAEAMYYLVSEKGQALREPVLKMYAGS
ncbi:MAG: SDR family NAD(P)-dependent oxidoreductase [Cyclobacteriaceae bacterium]|nr:SDR family NAD(P)-dependent oxidoreductase [Cyclobacteriaceae bacterium]